ncbi:formate dehydrogenase subunit gamma [Antarcticimicrobium sediminis]|uniref:Formate dehydrogenase subunit gamma n=1 Tax=Antarcticimicrobium sediminis TaxID=2546227 RepID=A0A4R5EYF6_9RHOB|nr:formate dehydrogenase subunit gamma [Antarcticimicrobium sediminis]
MAIITHRLLAFIAALMLVLLQAGAGTAQQAAADPHAATGGAQTLEDILARQRGEAVDDDFRRGATGDPSAAAPITGQLGTLGGVSDPELWRALRYGTADVIVSSRAPAAAVVIQDSGMRWLAFREGPLATYGGYLLLGVLVALLLFYLLRGRIRIDGEKTGIPILRFSAIERFAHWLLAGSFVLLGITGLTLLFGRMAIIPLLGKESYAPLAHAGKWVHNNVSWAFMLGLVLVTLFWLVHNIPNRHDLKWLAQAGGMFSKGVHPPAKKFNAGQKLIFWGVLVLGVSISVSGLSLLFPFQISLFAGTFETLNNLGLPQLVGLDALPSSLLPHQEMQLAQLWHAIVAFLFIAMILAHIYLGSIGMEGAFDAMGSGQVDEQWAKEHHGLWYEEVTGKPAHDPTHHAAD